MNRIELGLILMPEPWLLTLKGDVFVIPLGYEALWPIFYTSLEAATP